VLVKSLEKMTSDGGDIGWICGGGGEDEAEG
jgi:hypothetical protein